MKIEKYALKAEKDLTTFEFVSEGPRGAIGKLVQFQETNEENLFNLAFGDKVSETKIDDLSVSNNGDSEKVLATVVGTLYAFFEKHPSAFVYATGSTKARTRLYRMGITKYYNEIIKDFYLYGQIANEFVNFEIGTDYDGFLVQRKSNQIFNDETIQETNNRKAPIVTIDASLEKYKNRIICPEKLSKANKMLETAKLPKSKHQMNDYKSE